MTTWQVLGIILVFPGGIFLIFNSWAYEWVDRKLLARLQNRLGPRWFQPIADTLKLLLKEEIIPVGTNQWLFIGLPLIALSGALTAGLYVPIAGLSTSYSFPGDLIVTFYLLSLLTICIGVAGIITPDRFALVGSARALTQLFSYEAPFLLALLGPAIVAGSWQIKQVLDFSSQSWLLFTQPIGFVVALIGLMGKLELTPFDAPEAHTEIIAGALTEYSGRGLAVFRLAKNVELVVGLTLLAGFYLGGIGNPLSYLLKTLFLLCLMVGVQALAVRLKIDQTVGVWWRYGALLALVQMLLLLIGKEIGL